MDDGASQNREVYIDKMEFNKVDDSIKQVIPTHKGAKAIILKELKYYNQFKAIANDEN